MNDVQDALVFYDALTPQQRQALQTAIETDPALGEALARWQQVRAELRSQLESCIPDRCLLVLYALDAEGYRECITSREREALEVARPALERAMQAHPALIDIVLRIQAEHSAFDRAWEDAFKEPLVRPGRDRAASPPIRRRSSGLRWAWRAGSLIAVFAFAALLVLLVQRDRNTVTVQTASGEMKRIELADGSVVRLGSESQLSYADPGQDSPFGRRVRLQGRAFFEVAQGGQSFTVETSDALTTVLGTTFSVRADEAGTEVVLATGKVALAPREMQERIVVLQPGEMSRVAPGALASTPAPVELSEALEWTGLLVFRATPVADIAGRLSDLYGASVKVSPALQEQEVTGTFEQTQTVDEILQALALTLGAEVRADGFGDYTLLLPGQNE